jgi:hypothetical protein
MMRPGGLLLLAALTACDKPSGDATPASATTSASAPASSPAAASASSAPATPASMRSWHGTYKSVASTLTAPVDGKKVHWSDAPTTEGIGDGKLALTVDGASGHATGTIDGPLGPATLDGVVTDGKLAATIRRKDPTDRGFTGTLLGSVASDRLEGTMSVTMGLASALRTATFTLTPAGVAP